MNKNLTTTRNYLFLVLSFLLINLWGCKSGEKEYTPTPNTAPVSAPAANDAESHYQQLIAQYGENYQECLKPIKVKLAAVQKPKQVGELPLLKQLNVLIALDASGSMAKTVSGGKKIDVSESAIKQFVKRLPTSAKVGLTVFGHKGSSKTADKAVSCAEIENVYPLNQLNNSQFNQAINTFKPIGYTPLAATLEQLNQNLSGYSSAINYNVVYLVVGGIENCDGDPVAMAKKLHASNAKVIVNVIGFDVNNAAQTQLKMIAKAGGGKYFFAQNAIELNKVFRNYTQALSKYNKYTIRNTSNQNKVRIVMASEMDRLNLCMTSKMNQEYVKIISAANGLSVSDRHYRYSVYIRQRLDERRDQIRTWRDQLNVDLQNRRDVNIDKLQQQLNEATREIKKT